jgi:hypothetical protein
MPYGFGNSKIQKQLQELKDEKAARRVMNVVPELAPDAPEDIVGDANVNVVEDVIDSPTEFLEEVAADTKWSLLKNKLCCCWGGTD